MDGCSLSIHLIQIEILQPDVSQTWINKSQNIFLVFAPSKNQKSNYLYFKSIRTPLYNEIIKTIFKS